MADPARTLRTHPARHVRGDHAEYERRKREWADANPGATAAQYARALRQIANRCGV